MMEMSKNYQPASNPSESAIREDPQPSDQAEPLYQPATQSNNKPEKYTPEIPEKSVEVISTDFKPEEIPAENDLVTPDKNASESRPNRSLFERFFKNKAE